MNENDLLCRNFAHAYIQTLPHVAEWDDFSSAEEYNQYLEDRRESYFNEYLAALYFASNHPVFNNQEDYN